MATLPQANVSINEAAGAFTGGQTQYCVVMGCVAQNADSVPRLFSSSQNLVSQYAYAPAVDYAALHFDETNLPIIFVGLPIVTQGVIGSQNTNGVTGTCPITVTAGSSGPMDQVSGVVTVVTGGTIGTDQIALLLSCDGGESTQPVRLGTATSYAIPNLGLTLNFGAGTLNAGDVFTFQTTAPMWGSTAMSTARQNLAAQQNLARTWMAVGDVPNVAFAGYVLTEANNYASANDRFTLARAQVSDRSPLATKSQVSVAMTGTPTITFDGTGHTITRSAGSFIADGFVTGQMIKVAGATAGGDNGVFGPITVTSATVLTLAAGLASEGPDVAGAVSIHASEELTFAAGTTITRVSGDWVKDGFAVGQTVSITGSASNNVTAVITTLTSTVLTAAATTFTSENAFGASVAVAQVQTMSAWVSAQTAAFATVSGQKRIDLGLGRCRVQSPITGWTMRRPAQWAVSCREYQHDVQIPTYRHDDGNLSPFTLADGNGQKVEFDERTDGGGLAGLFTCLRTYANGPLGAFVALSLTRDTDGAILSRSHNMNVANVALTVVQAATESTIGQVLQLNADGTGTDASLSKIELRVNKALQTNLLGSSLKEGPRCSSAKWTASRTDVLTPGSTLNGVLELKLDGTIENISTVARVS